MTVTSVSAVTVYSAHGEWASRPPDERFARVHALFDAARERRRRIEEHTIETGEFRTEADGEALTLRETSSRTADSDALEFRPSRPSPARRQITSGPYPRRSRPKAITHGPQRIRRERHQLFVESTAPHGPR